MAAQFPEGQIFQGADSLFYWRIKATNGKVTGVGGEGFVSRGNARRALKRHIQMLLPGLIKIVNV